MERSKLRIALVAVVLLGAGPSSSTFAQEDATWMQFTVVNVLPERWDDYIELQLQEVNPGLRAAGVPWRSVWRTAEFGNNYELTFVIPITDLTQYDSGGPLARVMEPNRLQRVRDRIRRFTVSRRSYAVKHRTDLSIESDEVGELFLLRVSTIQVSPGRTADWERFLAENLPKFAGADLIFGVYQRIFGPGPTAWLIAENHASFAELEQPSILARTFGTQVDQMASRLAGVLVSIERTVLRYEAELSYSGPPASEP